MFTTLRKLTFLIIIIIMGTFLPLLLQAADEVRFSWALLLDSEDGLTALDFSKQQKIKKQTPHEHKIS